MDHINIDKSNNPITDNATEPERPDALEHSEAEGHMQRSLTRPVECKHYTDRHRKDCRSMPELRVSKKVHKEIMLTVGARPPETGGILLGPAKCSDVTDYYFDITGDCSGGTYSPDYITLRRKMKEDWLPVGIDMKGFVHSHPAGFAALTAGDLRYIARLLAKNDDMEMFAAPIVLPMQFRICPFVVLRQAPRKACPAKLVLF